MKLCKRLPALILALLLTMMLFPAAVHAQGTEEPEALAPRVLTEDDYETANAIFDAIYSSVGPQTRGVPSGLCGQDVYDLVGELPGVVPDSLQLHGGDFVVWMTESGVACGWSAAMQEILDRPAPEEMLEPQELTVEYGTTALHGKDIYVLQPYYGIDAGFKDQYYQEGKKLAELTGGTLYYKTQSAVTIDFLAEAAQKGGVIFFDTHGDTDYENPNDRRDYVTGAHTSYMTLQTNKGLTTADYAFDKEADCYHAVYLGHGSGGNPNKFMYAVDGTVITNHMKGNGSGGLFWSTSCLCMATDGVNRPLREKGVGIVYGYTQVVTFVGDYCFGRAFFAALREGKDVAGAITAMKERYGKWDKSPQIAATVGFSSSWYSSTEEQAKRNRCSFPILVSDQDPYPGHGKVDAVQPVYSTWKLVENCEHNYKTVNYKAATCISEGYTGDKACSVCGHVKSKGTAIAALGHKITTVKAKAASCTEAGYTGDAVCSVCGYVKKTGTVTAALGHSYLEWTIIVPPLNGTPGVREHACERCGWTDADTMPHMDCPSYEFRDVYMHRWYHDSVDFVVGSGIMNGVTDTSFDPNGKMTRAQLAQVLYNLAGKPDGAYTNPFRDVKETSWYYDAVVWAADCGIVNGVSAAAFEPKSLVSRQDMVVMLYRAYGEGETVASDGLDSFADSDQIRDYARSAMSWAVEHGYIVGSNGKLTPKSPMTRAEAATVFMNIFASQE